MKTENTGAGLKGTGVFVLCASSSLGSAAGVDASLTVSALRPGLGVKVGSLLGGSSSTNGLN